MRDEVKMSDTELNLVISNTLKNKIHTIRGIQVMLDGDLAKLYGVSTGRLNEQVRRNILRFPNEFMFQLTVNEYKFLRSQFAFANASSTKKRYLPYVFTEQGVSILLRKRNLLRIIFCKI